MGVIRQINCGGAYICEDSYLGMDLQGVFLSLTFFTACFKQPKNSDCNKSGIKQGLCVSLKIMSQSGLKFSLSLS